MNKQKSANPPAHYSSLSLRNFRGFKRADHIPLTPLTFLVGPNSAGKSSIFDAILFVTQSDFSLMHGAGLTPNWGGPLVDLGSYQDAVFNHNTRLGIEIGLELSLSSDSHLLFSSGTRSRFDKYPILATYGLKTEKGDPIGRLSNYRLTDSATGMSVSFSYAGAQTTMSLLDRRIRRSGTRGDYALGSRNWILSAINEAIRQLPSRPLERKSGLRRLLRFITTPYLNWLWRTSERVSSGRLAPKRWYPATDVRYRPRGYFLAPQVFDSVDPAMVEDIHRELSPFYRPKRRRQSPKRTLESMLEELEIASQIRHSKLSPYHSSISVTDSTTGITSNLIDVGYGASQVIPILYACLGDARGPLFVEQPEIHLHPRAQGVVAELLCRTSSERQVIVETHSVHMINRARILVAQGKLSPEHVIVDYVTRTRTGSRVQSIPILKNGDFGAPWPGGFFDERYEDTMQLLQLKDAREG